MTVKTIAVAIAAILVVALSPIVAEAARFGGVPTPPYVTVIYGPCPDGGPDTGGCAVYDPPTIYLRDRDPFTRQHELGHLADDQLLIDTERAQLTPLLDILAGTAWNGGTNTDCTPKHPCPSERFADAYATCRLRYWPQWAPGTHTTTWESGWYGYNPRTNRRQAAICYAIRTFLR